MERRKVMAEAKDCGLEAAAEAFGITDPQDTGECVWCTYVAVRHDYVTIPLNGDWVFSHCYNQCLVSVPIVDAGYCNALQYFASE